MMKRTDLMSEVMDLNPKYVNSNGKIVAGGAAQQHLIKLNGGWQNHHEIVVQKTITKVAQQITQEILQEQNREIVKSTLTRAK